VSVVSEEIQNLNDEIFNAIEESQGYFHVSDGECFATKAEFFERMRGRLRFGRKACRILAAFLKRHGEL
jgi:hypothetical protein